MTTATVKDADCGCDDGGEFAAVTAHDEDGADTTADPRGKKVTRWRSLLAPVGKPTGDKRRFAAGALSNRELPLPLKWQRADQQGHSTSVVIGTIDGIEHKPEGTFGTGILFTPDPVQLPRLAEDVNEAKALLEQRVIGPSVDLDDMEFRVDQPEGEMSADVEPGQPERRPAIEVTKGRISAATLVPIAAFAETAPDFVLYEVDVDSPEATPAPAVTASAVRSHGWRGMPKVERDWDALGAVGRLRAWAGGDAEAFKLGFLYDSAAGPLFPIADVVDGQLVVVPAAVTAATGVLEAGNVSVPEAARMAMLDVLDHIDGDWWFEDEGLVPASAFPTLTAGAVLDVDALPPAEWFHDPKLDGPTPVTVTPDGRVFGHLATWGTCHTGMPGACVTPPKSRTNYAFFHTGETLTDEGPVGVGRISLGGGHADTRLGFRAASDHYDSTSACVATVRAGQDKHGVWIAGTTVPGLDAYKVAELRRSPLSGDWRRIGGQLELVHALAVNSPGFPVPRASMVASSVPGGEMVQNALVAAGVLQVDGDAGDAQEAPDLAATVASAVEQGIAAYRAGEDRKAEAARLLSGLQADFAASAEARTMTEARRLLGAF